MRTKQYLILEEIEICVDLTDYLITYGQRATAGEFNATLFHQFDNRILNNLSIYIECGDRLISSHAAQDCVSHVTYTTLQWNEFFRKTAGLDLANQEVRNVFTDRHRNIIQRREFSTFIRLIGSYHTNDLSRVYFYTIVTDPVRRSVDRDLTA